MASLAFVAASLAPAQAHACVQPRELGMAFAIDDSGSMSTSDPDKLRLAAARAGIDQVPDGSTVAVSSFDSTSRSQVEPINVNASNREGIKNSVFGVASGDTYYDLGFAEAQRQLDGMATADQKALIFLSDGQPTDPGYAVDRQLAAKGVRIFTIGFGEAPPTELQGIAARSGGNAYTIQSPSEAQAVFAKIVSTLECDTAKTSVQFSLAPGESRVVPFTVDPNDREFRSLTTWSNGDVGVSLRRPNNTFLAPGGVLSGETYTAQPTYTSAGGLNPAAGVWNVNVTASAQNVDSVNVTVDVWRRDRLWIMGLGDSVAAGFGLHTGTPQNIRCGLSLPTSACDSPNEAWPARVANALRPAAPSLAFGNFAIAGSQASQWVNNTPRTRGNWQLAPALTNIAGTRPDYALVTLGANDLLQKKTCMAREKCVTQVKKEIQRDMTSFYNRLGIYPRTIIFSTLYYHLDVDPYGAVDQINDALIAAAAKSSRRVVLVAPPDFRGHGCGAGAQSWMLGRLNDGCLHPNATGQQMIANQVLSAMQGNAAAVNAKPVAKRLSALANIIFYGYPLNKLTTELHAFGVKRTRVAYKYVYGKVRRGKASAAAAGKRKRRARTRTRVITKQVKLKQGNAVIRTRVPRTARTRGAKLYVRLLGTKKCVRYTRAKKGKRGRKHRKCKRYRREGATRYKLLTVIPATPGKATKGTTKRKRGAKKKRARASAASAVEERASRPSCASLTMRVDGRDVSGGVQVRGDLTCGEGVALLRDRAEAERSGWVCNAVGRKAECRRDSASVDFAAP